MHRVPSHSTYLNSSVRALLLRPYSEYLDFWFRNDEINRTVASTQPSGAVAFNPLQVKANVGECGAAPVQQSLRHLLSTMNRRAASSFFVRVCDGDARFDRPDSYRDVEHV